MTTPTDLLAEFERKYRRPTPGRTLIAGSCVYGGKQDRRALYADAVGVDLQDGPGVDVVYDLELDTHNILEPTFSHIECRSVLEHAKRPWRLAATLERLLLPGGTIDITVPFCWRLHSYPSDYWRFTADAVREIFPSIEWRALAYASGKLSKRFRVPKHTVDGVPYFPRTEVFGFGVKK